MGACLHYTGESLEPLSIVSCASQGVIEFSLCLLFAKLVSYTFLYWLPLYIFNVGKSQGDRT